MVNMDDLPQNIDELQFIGSQQKHMKRGMRCIKSNIIQSKYKSMQHLSMLRSANSFRLTPWFSHSELSPSVSVTVWILVEVKWGFTEVLRVGKDCKGGWRKCITEFGLSLEPYGIASNVLYLYILYIYIYLYQNLKFGPGKRHSAPLPWANHSEASDFGISEVDFRNACINEWKAHCSENPPICCCVSCWTWESFHSLGRFLIGYIFCNLDTKVHCEEWNRLKEQSILAKSC